MKPLRFVSFVLVLAAALPAQPLPAPLSKATLETIARMKPIFDGATLDGWIQAPPAPTTFSSSDITDLDALIKKLQAKSDPVSGFIARQLDEGGQAVLAAGSPTPDPRAATSALIRNLNRIVNGPSIQDATVTPSDVVRPATRDSRRPLDPFDLPRLNRLQLEDAFPNELARSPSSSWIVKEGAMASTGGGRGVIYTRDDYARYRLVFTMRHVSGNPDHQPCVLVFCTRPAPGERGLDALGAIQLQTPNGGHWDYRPGRNNAGTAFTRPVRTTFDNHQWHQVEILVDARNGTARMAVAQPVGTRAIENLTFSDPEAGKPGPIAWQMHNAGLFDEFKDVRIEVNPSENRLITVE
jgi:hypothetical protein